MPGRTPVGPVIAGHCDRLGGKKFSGVAKPLRYQEFNPLHRNIAGAAGHALPADIWI
ncbi:hypothetical protein [Pseudoxanthomonas mexicana]|uniref:hypothetical protein n=1 Tax=Pseudoxanthomonas mexicana TaxID=128785 RepID=UPI00398AFEBB